MVTQEGSALRAVAEGRRREQWQRATKLRAAKEKGAEKWVDEVARLVPVKQHTPGPVPCDTTPVGTDGE